MTSIFFSKAHIVSLSSLPKIYCWYAGNSEEGFYTAALTESGVAVTEDLWLHKAPPKNSVEFLLTKYVPLPEHPDGYHLIWLEPEDFEIEGFKHARKLNKFSQQTKKQQMDLSNYTPKGQEDILCPHNRGEKILVSDDGKNWNERIFLAYIGGASLPYLAVDAGDEKMFGEGKEFDHTAWVYAKPIPQKVKLTLQDIHDGKGTGVPVELMEIVF